MVLQPSSDAGTDSQPAGMDRALDLTEEVEAPRADASPTPDAAGPTPDAAPPPGDAVISDAPTAPPDTSGATDTLAPRDTAPEDTGTGGLDAASSVPRVVTGSYMGDGVDGRAITGLPFPPSVVLVRAFASAPTVLKTTTMVGDAAKDMSSQAALGPDLVQALTSDGFQVGTGLNDATRVYHYAAFAPSPQLAVGTYTGAGAAAVSVSGLGFAPAYVIVTSGRAWTQLRSSTMPSAAGVFGFSYAGLTLTAGGFAVAASSELNVDGETHHYVAWNSADPRTAAASYQGNGLDNRLIPTAFPPELAIVQCASTMRNMSYDFASALWRPASLPTVTDRTLAFGSTVPFAAGHIQGLLAGGFEVGDADPVNAAGQPCHFVVFGR